jgi:hypothetical protein
MEQCAALHNKVLGPDHLDALSSYRTLSKWEQEDYPFLSNHPLPPDQAKIIIFLRKSQQLWWSPHQVMISKLAHLGFSILTSAVAEEAEKGSNNQSSFNVAFKLPFYGG